MTIEDRLDHIYARFFCRQFIIIGPADRIAQRLLHN